MVKSAMVVELSYSLQCVELERVMHVLGLQRGAIRHCAELPFLRGGAHSPLMDPEMLKGWRSKAAAQKSSYLNRAGALLVGHGRLCSGWR